MASPVYEEDDDDEPIVKDQRAPAFNISWKTFVKNEPLIVAGLLGTTLVLFTGLVNSFYFKNTKWDQRLMRARVAGQALTVAFLGWGVFKMEGRRAKFEEQRRKRQEEEYVQLGGQTETTKREEEKKN